MKKRYLAFICLTLMGCSKQSSDDYLLSAKGYIGQQDYQAAMIELKNAIVAEPNSAEARFLLGKLYVQTGNFESAEKELNRALEYKYDAAEVIPLLSFAYQKTGSDVALAKLVYAQSGLTPEQAAEVAFYKLAALRRLEQDVKAKALIEEIKTYRTDSPFKGLSLAYAMLLDKNNAAALLQVDEVLNVVATQPDALKLKAQLLLQAKDVAQAVDVYQRYYQSYPDDHEASFALVRLLSNLNRTEEAEPIIDKLLKINADNTLLNQFKGLARFNDKDYQNALVHTEKALLQNPEDPALRLIAGYSGYFLNDFELAHQNLLVIADKLPPSHPALRIMAASQLKLGLHLAAQTTLNQLDDMSKNDAALISNVGLALVSAGEFEKAKTLVDKSTLVSKSADELTRLGVLQLSLNDVDGIVKLEQALDMDADQQFTKSTLATAYLSTKQFDKALALATQWQQEHPDEVQSYLLAGMTYAQLKEFDQAKKEFNQALHVEPGNRSAKMALIDLSFMLGDKAAAKTELDQLLKTEPTFLPALAKQYLLAREQGDSAASIALIRKSHADNVDNDNLTVLLAKVLVAEGKQTEATTLLEPLIANEKRLLIPAWEMLGQLYFWQRKFNKAEQHYKKWLTLAPNNYDATLGNIMIADVKQEFVQGLTLTTATLKKRHDDVKMQLLQLHFLIQTGDIAAAKKQLSALTTENQALPFAKGLLGQIQLSEEKYQRALTNLQVAYQSMPNARNTRMIFFSYIKLAQSEQAYSFISKHVDAHPQDLPSLMLLADLQINRNVGDAIKSYEKVLTLDADNVVALNNLAYFYLKNGALNKAQSHAEHALALQPEQADVLDTLAQILIAKKQLKQAISYLGKAAGTPNVKEEIYLNYIEALLLNNENNLARKKVTQRNFKQQSSLDKLAMLEEKYNF